MFIFILFPNETGELPSGILRPNAVKHIKKKKKMLVYLFCGINREFIKIRKIYIPKFYSPGVEFFNAYK